MAADDHPFDAIKRRFEMEDKFPSPVSRVVLDWASRVPMSWPLNGAISAIKDQLAGDGRDRIRITLETCVDEIRKQESAIERLQATLPAEELQRRAAVAAELLLDAARKSESTRATDRVRRIGLILANSIGESAPIEADEIEEMMRTAMDVSDRDIYFLAELIRIEGGMLKTAEYIPRGTAHGTWESGHWGSRINPEIDSVFSKLESYGLVSRVPPPSNLNIYADFQNRYVLLKKGLRFSQLIHERAVEKDSKQ